MAWILFVIFIFLLVTSFLVLPQDHGSSLSTLVTRRILPRFRKEVTWRRWWTMIGAAKIRLVQS